MWLQETTFVLFMKDSLISPTEIFKTKNCNEKIQIIKKKIQIIENIALMLFFNTFLHCPSCLRTKNMNSYSCARYVIHIFSFHCSNQSTLSEKDKRIIKWVQLFCLVTAPNHSSPQFPTSLWLSPVTLGKKVLAGFHPL